MNLPRATEKGFTLIELLVVISIIGMLSSTILASLNAARSKARDVRRISDAKQIQTALELYYSTFNQYPDSSLVPGQNGSTGNTCYWCSSMDSSNPWIPQLAPTYIPIVPVDPVNSWYNEQVYYFNSNGTDYCIQISQENNATANPYYAGTWSGTYKLRLGPNAPLSGACGR